MSRLRVIGVGSPFGMDRIGLLAAERLLGMRDRLPEGAEVCLRDRPGMALLEDFEGADGVVILDAVRGGRAGRIRCLDPGALQALASPASTHGFGVAEVLALAVALGRMPERVRLIGVETGGYPQAEPPPQLVAALVEQALRTAWECARQAAHVDDCQAS